MATNITLAEVTFCNLASAAAKVDIFIGAGAAVLAPMPDLGDVLPGSHNSATPATVLVNQGFVIALVAVTSGPSIAAHFKAPGGFALISVIATLYDVEGKQTLVITARLGDTTA